VLLTFNTAKELRPSEAKLLNGARLIQFMIGGVDFIPLSEISAAGKRPGFFLAEFLCNRAGLRPLIFYASPIAGVRLDHQR
jgi:hypothetical protein